MKECPSITHKNPPHIPFFPLLFVKVSLPFLPLPQLQPITIPSPKNLKYLAPPNLHQRTFYFHSRPYAHRPLLASLLFAARMRSPGEINDPVNDTVHFSSSLFNISHQLAFKDPISFPSPVFLLCIFVSFFFCVLL